MRKYQAIFAGTRFLTINIFGKSERGEGKRGERRGGGGRQAKISNTKRRGDSAPRAGIRHAVGKGNSFLTMNVFYEGRIKSYDKDQSIILDVFRSIQNVMEDNPETAEMKVDPKNKKYTITMLADNPEEYLEKKC